MLRDKGYIVFPIFVPEHWHKIVIRKLLRDLLNVRIRTSERH